MCSALRVHSHSAYLFCFIGFVIGLDLSLGMLQVARERHGGSALIDYVLADISQPLPFRSHVFDTALSVGELEEQPLPPKLGVFTFLVLDVQAYCTICRLSRTHEGACRVASLKRLDASSQGELLFYLLCSPSTGKPFVRCSQQVASRLPIFSERTRRGCSCSDGRRVGRLSTACGSLWLCPDFCLSTTLASKTVSRQLWSLIIRTALSSSDGFCGCYNAQDPPTLTPSLSQALGLRSNDPLALAA